MPYELAPLQVVAVAALLDRKRPWLMLPGAALLFSAHLMPYGVVLLGIGHALGMGMLFGKRRWAFRVVERAGFEVLSGLGAALVNLLVARAKASERASRQRGDLLHIRNAAVALESDEAALDELARIPGGRPAVAEKISRTAREMFLLYG